MIDMLPRFPVSVAFCRDMKVTLDLVDLHIPKDPTCLLASALPGVCAGPGGGTRTTFFALGHDSPEVVVTLLCVVLRELVHALWVPPSRFLFQNIPREDTVPGSVLHVDMDVAAWHGDGQVDIDLEVLADGGVDRKVLLLDAVEVHAELGPHEENADN